MTLDDLDDRLTVTFEGCGWAHLLIMLRMRLWSKLGGELRMNSATQTKKPANFRLRAFVFCGSPTWTRTRDLRINSPSLYQLSYQGTEAILSTRLLRLSKSFRKRIV